MNKQPDGPPVGTCFDAPDVSRLYERSQELTARTKIVIDRMAKISRRMNEAIAYSDRILQEIDKLKR
jgi:hypothetical protein